MTRLRILLTVFVMTIFTTVTFGQDILMTIAGNDITIDEFERIYNKNNNSLNTNQQTPEEYLELFINFKLKVAEAENLGMDTTQSFLKEFNGYKEQLAKPYMTDDETKEEMMREAYARLLFDVHASHILLGLSKQPSPKDTLAVYEKAMEIRQRIINGEDFTTVAQATSDDPSAKTNGGDLGYFTVFMMLYQFESAAYNLEIGDISMPVRTRYGYHLIKAHDKRPAVGQVKIAHIFVRAPDEFSNDEKIAAKEKMFSAYDSIKMGSDFGEIAKNISEDRNSARAGGEIPFFGTGRMFSDFEKVAFSLKDSGDISEPFKSTYGWHLIKLIEKQPVGSYEEMESTLQSRALKGDRDRIKRDRYLSKLKKDYNYQLNKDSYRSLYEIIDSTIFGAEWTPNMNVRTFDDDLFTIINGGASVDDFIQHLIKGHRKIAPVPITNFIDLRFSQYLENYMLENEKSTLPQRFPEYRYILQEYHDGILLFDLMDQKVWSHAVEDTVGLEAFYAENRNDYMWEERVSAVIVSCDSGVDVSLVMKKASKISSGKWDEDKLNEKFCSSDSTTCISIQNLKVEEGVNEHVDALNKTIGTGEVYEEAERNNFVIVHGLIKPTPKELNETRGQVTSDYQDYLEIIWLKELRGKYKVEINKELLSEIEQ